MDTLPTSGGGNGKYVAVGLLLLLGLAGAYFATKPAEEPEGPAEQTAAAAPTPPMAARRQTYSEALDVPEPEEVDAGTMEPAAEEHHARHHGMRSSMMGGSSMTAMAASCDGNLPTSAVRGAFRSQSGAIRACYERQLKRNHFLEGSLRLTVQVGRNGHVDSVRTGGTLRDRTVTNCVKQVARAMRFPPVEGGTCATVSAPFRFSPSN